MTQSAAHTPPFLIEAARSRSGDDPIFALNAEAQRRARGGEAVVNATLGALMDDQGKLAVMKSVFETLAAVDPQRAAGYAPIAGERGFLDAVVGDLFGASELARCSVAASTPGGTGALHHAIVNFLEPGQALLAPEYYWGPYKTLADHTRRKVETFRMFDGARRFDSAAFERGLEGQLRTQGRALVLLNTPCNNPTGYSLDAQEWSDVTRIVRAAARRAPVALLVDHAYAKFGGANAERWVEHAAQIVGEALLLVAWTASKSFTQYGARVGALVAVHPDESERQRARLLVPRHVVELQPRGTTRDRQAARRRHAARARRRRTRAAAQAPRRTRRGLQHRRARRAARLPALRGRLLRQRLRAAPRGRGRAHARRGRVCRPDPRRAPRRAVFDARARCSAPRPSARRGPGRCELTGETVPCPRAKSTNTRAVGSCSTTMDRVCTCSTTCTCSRRSPSCAASASATPS
jgi:aspartate/tyrosine/aromatic aminotransferase